MDIDLCISNKWVIRHGYRIDTSTWDQHRRQIPFKVVFKNYDRLKSKCMIRDVFNKSKIIGRLMFCFFFSFLNLYFFEEPGWSLQNTEWSNFNEMFLSRRVNRLFVGRERPNA